ncbi:Mediator of RNA polymerase II transcription subunit 7 [Neonectria punicea]|uniref:Mediator of RNA polymerase II transcription subunit 7 n=1 Tax=Neonectria punicea TaxID=979145 RepID=A0ABR1HL17_9HYPO
MADQQESNTLASTFPNPPSFWRDFTPDKLARFDELKAVHAQQHGGDSAPTRIPGLPDELINLQPPLEPADGRWRVFGDQYMLDDKLPTLEEQGIANLPSTAPSDSRDVKHFDRALELKRLAKSLLLNFLELSGTLSRNASHAEGKVQDLRTLFINFHHILNEYRPHQARESAITMMQEHLDRTRTETMAIRTQVDKARRVLDGLESLSVPEVPKPLGDGDDGDWEAAALERESDSWAATDALFA